MKNRRLLSYNEIHGGERYWVEPRGADVQRGVGRGVFAQGGELATATPYVLDLIQHAALLPFDGPPDTEPAPESPAPKSAPATTPPKAPKGRNSPWLSPKCLSRSTPTSR